ncbi:ABC transporter permease [Bhargavaea ullalensis]|uniref:ABC-2 type transport system permease protein n=1 Tax=Bhargavaea ullalensis TaxID=1265685 RepID=A0ABV2G7D0_9BACL
MLTTQLKYDLVMFFREIFYLIFTIVIPPVTYLFMGQLFGGATYGDNLNYVQFYTPSFIILITFSVVFFAFGFDQVMNRSMGIEKRISISPVDMRTLLFSNIIKSVIITTLGFMTITFIGITVYSLEIGFADFLKSYGVFILINAALLTVSSAIYSFFKEMKSALVFSIVLFQVVLFTADFTVPVDGMPKFIQVIANLNPLYHINHLFIDVWNGMFSLNGETAISLGYIAALVFISMLLVTRKAKN